MIVIWPGCTVCRLGVRDTLLGCPAAKRPNAPRHSRNPPRRVFGLWGPANQQNQRAVLRNPSSRRQRFCSRFNPIRKSSLDRRHVRYSRHRRHRFPPVSLACSRGGPWAGRGDDQKNPRRCRHTMSPNRRASRDVWVAHRNGESGQYLDSRRRFGIQTRNEPLYNTHRSGCCVVGCRDEISVCRVPTGEMLFVQLKFRFTAWLVGLSTRLRTPRHRN